MGIGLTSTTLFRKCKSGGTLRIEDNGKGCFNCREKISTRSFGNSLLDSSFRPRNSSTRYLRSLFWILSLNVFCSTSYRKEQRKRSAIQFMLTCLFTSRALCVIWHKNVWELYHHHTWSNHHISTSYILTLIRSQNTSTLFWVRWSGCGRFDEVCDVMVVVVVVVVVQRGLLRSQSSPVFPSRQISSSKIQDRIHRNDKCMILHISW